MLSILIKNPEPEARVLERKNKKFLGLVDSQN